jgi:ribosomal protein S18 acetylase RimI-like enzyme
MLPYALVEQVPGCDEYIALRLAAGLSEKTREAALKGLPGTLFAVCVRTRDRLIGMGRIIGDGGCHFEVVDIAVHPDYQRRGIGYQIMEALMQYLRSNAPKSAHVSLLADNGAPALYRKFGFEFTAPDSVGMALQM